MISILMPVKNASPYLAECIDSILSQSHVEWELIAINDNSTDDSVEIIERYQLTDARIQIYSNQHVGIIEALKLAYSKSSGNYITRMDADDIMLPLKLEKLLAIIKEHPTVIATAKVKYFSANQLGDGYKNYENWLNQLIDNQSHYDNIYTECVLPSPCWMMRKETLDLIGGFSDLSYPEDYDLCFKAYSKNIQIEGSTECLHLWRDYQERTSRNDPNYADNTFIPLKLSYFIDVDYRKDSGLVLWGAGNKGKKIAQLLIAQNIKFRWLSNNPKKVGHNIYGIVLEIDQTLSQIDCCQLIISIADKSAKNEINKLLKRFESKDIHWFC